jgi:hypothetical protein
LEKRDLIGPVNTAGIKFIPARPWNPQKYGLPRASALIILVDPETLIPSCVMDGAIVSAMRTGAAAGVAAKYLANPGSKILGLVGASVQGRTQLMETARAVCDAGAKILRGGAFKPRTSPYTFQGLGEEGLKHLNKVGDELGLVTVSEVMDTRDVELVAKYVDVFQIGARNMQNFNLLKEVGLTKKTVMLKRGLSCTIKELLMSAEYILSNGNFNVVLCERGIRTFEDLEKWLTSQKARVDPRLRDVIAKYPMRVKNPARIWRNWRGRGRCACPSSSSCARFPDLRIPSKRRRRLEKHLLL